MTVQLHWAGVRDEITRVAPGNQFLRSWSGFVSPDPHQEGHRSIRGCPGGLSSRGGTAGFQMLKARSQAEKKGNRGGMAESIQRTEEWDRLGVAELRARCSRGVG